MPRKEKVERSFKYGTGIFYTTTSSKAAQSRLYNGHALDLNRLTAG